MINYTTQRIRINISMYFYKKQQGNPIRTACILIIS